MDTAASPAHAGHHHLCLRPLAASAGPPSLRCDAAGQVDLDALDRRERLEYLYARALVGRDVVRPCVVALAGSGQ